MIGGISINQSVGRAAAAASPPVHGERGNVSAVVWQRVDELKVGHQIYRPVRIQFLNRDHEDEDQLENVLII